MVSVFYYNVSYSKILLGNWWILPNFFLKHLQHQAQGIVREHMTCLNNHKQNKEMDKSILDR